MKTWESLSKAFYVVGIFFFALSLGWAFGLRSAHADVQTVGVLFGVGMLTLFSAAFLQSRISASRRRIKEKLSRSDPLDLEACFRAYKNYGEQVPLLQSAGLHIEAFAITSKKTYAVPPNFDTCLVELWDGLEVKVTHADKMYRVPLRSICKIDISGEVLILDPVLGAGEGACQGLVHFFSSGLAVD